MANINCNSRCFFHSTSCLTWESNSFQANGPFLYPLIALENQMFSAVVGSFKIGTVVWNGWKVQHFFTPSIGNSNYKPIFFLHFFTILFAQKVTCKYIMRTYFDEGKLFGGKLSVGIDPGISSVLVWSINRKLK